MTTKKVTITNEYGIHCRPSSVIVKEALKYTGTITIKFGTMETTLSSMMGLLSLAIKCGDEIELFVDGPDEKETIKKFTDIFAKNFDFQR
ncbi:MAG: HPr family phosphocarrier protein [Verrucomicrobiota bacterium]|nr:HPr family phosphocarrier protein [Verrucomicrobiota bacterium]